MSFKNALILLSLFCVSNIWAQRIINYGIYDRPTSDAQAEALANIFAQRHPQRDFFYTDVRDDLDVETILANASGSPYVDTTFKRCRIIYQNEETGYAFYRFNAHNNEIELRETPTAAKTFSLNIDAKISIKDLETGEILMLKRVEEKDQVSNAYVNLLESINGLTLFRRTYIKFTEGREATSSMVVATKDKFTVYEDYFLERGNSKTLVLLKQNKKSIYELFEEDKAAIKTLIKTKSLDVKKESDLITLIQEISKFGV